MSDVPEGLLEGLHPDLRAHVRVGRGGMAILNHPLVLSISFGPTVVAHLNETLEFKRQAIERAKAEGDLDRIIQMHERPYRFRALREYGNPLCNDYWRHLRKIWTETELPHEDLDAWIEAWAFAHGRRVSVMRKAERLALAALPETVTIWRGALGRAAAISGLSWTTNRDEAIWFAHRWSFDPRKRAMLAEATVPREAIFAYLLDKSEHEVVVDPIRVSVVRVERAPKAQKR